MIIFDFTKKEHISPDIRNARLTTYTRIPDNKGGWLYGLLFHIEGIRQGLIMPVSNDIFTSVSKRDDYYYDYDHQQIFNSRMRELCPAAPIYWSDDEPNVDFMVSVTFSLREELEDGYATYVSDTGQLMFARMSIGNEQFPNALTRVLEDTTIRYCSDSVNSLIFLAKEKAHLF